MASRVVLRNRVVWQSPDSARPRRVETIPRDRRGEKIDCARAIPADSAESPFRAGTAVTLPDGITYRCVEHLDPLHGWATSEFWQKRWLVDHKAVLDYAMRGLLDAALEKGSSVKRYRCRDEYTLINSAEHRSHQHRVKNVRRRRDRKPWKD